MFHVYGPQDPLKSKSRFLSMGKPVMGRILREGTIRPVDTFQLLLDSPPCTCVPERNPNAPLRTPLRASVEHVLTIDARGTSALDFEARYGAPRCGTSCMQQTVRAPARRTKRRTGLHPSRTQSRAENPTLRPVAAMLLHRL